MSHTTTAAREKIPVTVHPSSATASRDVARQIAELIRDRAAKGKRAVLGLATGSTPVGIYEELVRLHNREGLSFRNVTSFNLDEYWPMGPDDLQSYRRFMREHLFDHVDIDPAHAHVPDGTAPRDRIMDSCATYERAIADAGGIDLQILGIGRTGHIGFNEPGSPPDSRTRLITLDRVTRMDAASDFFGEWNVPRQAMTMGVGTILSARRVVLMAFGEHKAGVVKRAVEGEITPAVAASFLQQHPGASFVLDPASSAALTRFATPWLLGPIAQFNQSWDERTVKRAVLWLAALVSKPILKLTDEDYNEHGLQELLSARGSAYTLNIEVFHSMQRTITGWPAGKPGRPRFVAGKGVADANGPDEFPKRVLVFSPHPDDDVISMGGTFIRLCDQGHEVHVAYQTSGNIAVFDDEAIRHADFVEEFARAFDVVDDATTTRIERHVEEFVKNKKPGQIDSPVLQKIKGLIRRTEARAGARYSGVKPENIHFMDLPFYETGRVKKKPASQDDVDRTIALLQRVRPHMVYAAGDLSDPHGTHRVCLAIITRALQQLGCGASSPASGGGGRAREPGGGSPAQTAHSSWPASCELWLYRGAWQEWEPWEIDMAVPLSPDEVDRKRRAIFKHQSQKDRALFPGPSDTREFWQRAEDRNRRTAELFDSLGLPEYQAMEGFVKWVAGTD